MMFDGEWIYFKFVLGSEIFQISKKPSQNFLPDLHVMYDPLFSSDGRGRTSGI
jgi:hypothetical protein